MRLTPSPPARLTVTEVAAAVGRTPNTVREWCRDGRIPAEWDARLRLHLVARADLDALLAAGGAAALKKAGYASRRRDAAFAARNDSRADVARLLADYHATRRRDLLRLATRAVADHIATHGEHPPAHGRRWYLPAGELAGYPATGKTAPAPQPGA